MKACLTRYGHLYISFFFLNRLEKSAIYNGEIVESAVLPTQNRMIRVVSCFFLWNGVFVVSTIRANLG